MDKPNYFDVTVWGAQGENCATYRQKGRPVAIDGCLEWREWEAQEGSGKRQAISIVAEHVQFLGARDAAEGTGAARRRAPSRPTPPTSSTPPPAAVSRTTTTCRSDRRR